MIELYRPPQPVSLGRAIRVELDDLEVGRLRRGHRLFLRGTGQEQKLRVRLDLMRSNTLLVSDPGSDEVVRVRAEFAPLWQTTFNSIFRPSRVLRLSREIP